MVMQLPPPVQWMSPTPLWTDLVHLVSNPASEDNPLIKPVILRFASDDFMQEFLTLLNNEPHRLLDWQAQSETWRSPIDAQEPVEVMSAFTRSLLERMNPAQPGLKLATTGHNGNGNGSTPSVEYDDSPLKLYQASHQRFYLVTASLVCRLFGLPDRMLDHGANEQVSFVVRRLRFPDPAQNPLQQDNLNLAEEYAFVPGPNEPQWVKVVNPERLHPRQLVPGEEKLPMFGVGYSTHDSQARRLVSGLIPVGKRETYVGAAFSEPGLDEPLPAVREHIFYMEVIAAWASLIKQDEIVTHVKDDRGVSDLEEQNGGFNEVKFRAVRNTQSESATWFILLNLAHFLSTYLQELWAVITDSSQDQSDLMAGSPAQQLYNFLSRHYVWSPSGSRKTIVQILREIEQKAHDVIDPVSGTTSHSWHNFSTAYRVISHRSSSVTNKTLRDDELAQLAGLVAAALADVELPTSPVPLMPYASQQNAPAAEPGWYVIRCVFEQPECDPIMPPEISIPTRAFQMAAFFDPQAPSRPVRISMPMDTTPEGLRQFAKNGAFILSDCLTCQIEAIRGLTLGDLIMAVLPWPLHKDLDMGAFEDCAEPGSGGMMLTLSLPIITICALIVLIVVASLLDLIFKWMPFFIALIPIPGLKREGA